MSEKQVLVLSNGVEMPCIGFGCAFGNWTDPSKFMGFTPEQGHHAIPAALRAGYTHFDCAFVYGSHRVVAQHIGQALAGGLSTRSDFFITTKICHPVSDTALNHIKKSFDFSKIAFSDIKERVMTDFETSLDELGCGYVDLLLMHWPGEFHTTDVILGRLRRKACWEVFEEIYKSGRARSIGVSNFLVRHLEALIEDTQIVPMVNQIEISPYIHQSVLISYCNENNIRLVAWSPFGSGSTGVLNDPVISRLAVKYRRTPGQIILRWLVQRGIGGLPKSSNEDRMKLNLAVFDFEISEVDMEEISSLDRNLSCVFTSDHIA